MSAYEQKPTAPRALNLLYLESLAQTARQDPALAVRLFGVSRAAAEWLASLDTPTLSRLASGVVLLYQARVDLRASDETDDVRRLANLLAEIT